MVTYFHSFRDLNGNLVNRSKFDYPYSYDEFVFWIGDYKKGESETVYSDRLYSWDSEKYNKCCLKVWNNKGQYFDNRKPEDIEKFLSLYMDMKIKLTAIVEGCNVSNGYPYWVFYYKEIE